MVDQISEDPSLMPLEKETIVRFSKSDDVAHIATDVASVSRRLLTHDAFALDAVRTDDAPATWADPSDIGADSAIHAVRGIVPIGSLTIGEPRDSNELYRIIAHESER